MHYQRIQQIEAVEYAHNAEVCWGPSGEVALRLLEVYLWKLLLLLLKMKRLEWHYARTLQGHFT